MSGLTIREYNLTLKLCSGSEEPLVDILSQLNTDLAMIFVQKFIGAQLLARVKQLFDQLQRDHPKANYTLSLARPPE